MSTLMPESRDLPDIQSLEDSREIAIDRVGVSNVRHPVQITDTDGTSQPVTATFRMTVSLPGDVKGTHMSRFLQILSEIYEKKASTWSAFLADTYADRCMRASWKLMMSSMRLEARDEVSVAFVLFVGRPAGNIAPLRRMDRPLSRKC